MINRKFFFDQIKLTLFSGSMSTKQVQGVSAILDEWEANYSRQDERWLAYMFATAHHETGRTMQPIEEWGKGKNLIYGGKVKQNKKPYTDTNEVFYGRGFVQLTWYENYERAGKELKKDFIHHAAGVMELPNATKIMFLGMMEGWFTGKKLSNYFAGTTEDWTNARRIINGLDKADLIKDYAQKYYASISHIAANV
ncbi:MAG: hypothetical protein CFE24_02220 [Flavobacterium sp. BFFFF2]|nr:MAG: hypothetical protein CFE24_02220 [Flavobacterium sp. BFFFF2]